MPRIVEVEEVVSTPDGDARIKVTLDDTTVAGQEQIEVRGRGYLQLTKTQLNGLQSLATTLITKARQALP